MRIHLAFGWVGFLLAIVSRTGPARPEVRVDVVKLKKEAFQRFRKEGLINRDGEPKTAKVYFQERYVPLVIDPLDDSIFYDDDSRFLVIIPNPSTKDSPRKIAFVLTRKGKKALVMVNTAHPQFPKLDLMVYGRLKQNTDQKRVERLKKEIASLTPALVVTWEPGDLMFGVSAEGSFEAEPFLAQAMERMKAIGEFLILKDSASAGFTDADEIPEVNQAMPVPSRRKVVSFDELKTPGFSPVRVLKDLVPKVPAECEGLITLGRHL